MRYLLIGYVIICCVFAGFLFVGYARIVPAEDKKSDKPRETSLDITLVVIGLVGMFFLLTNLESSILKSIWRPLSIALAAAQLYLNLKGRLDLLRSGEAKKGESELGYADLSTLLFLLPSLGLNIYYAFRQFERPPYSGNRIGFRSCVAR